MELRFTQEEVLQLVPLLKAKQLQNWVERGIVEPDPEKEEGKGYHRNYTVLGVVMLDFMAQMVALNIPPSMARDLADEVAGYAVEMWKTHRKTLLKGETIVIVAGDEMEKLRRCRVAMVRQGRNGPYVYTLAEIDSRDRRMISAPSVSIVVEVDALAIRTFTKIADYLRKEGKQWQ